jgi:hypothetical protein
MRMFIRAPLVIKQPDPPFIDRMFNEFGTTPRICLELTSTAHKHQQYSSTVDNAVDSLTLSKLEAFMFGDTPSPGGCFHKLFLLHRTQTADAFSLPSLSPMTNTISRRLSATFRILKPADQIRMYDHSIDGGPGWRTFSGMMYAAYCQQQFMDGIRIEYVPMVRPPDTESPSSAMGRETGNKGTSEEWHSTLSLLADLADLRLSAKEYLSVTPTTVLEYSERYLTVENLKEGVFYVPAAKNQVALDSFIIHRGSLFIFQFTVDKSHQINDGLLCLLSKGTGYLSSENVRLIFVIPGDVIMKTRPPGNP